MNAYHQYLMDEALELVRDADAVSSHRGYDIHSVITATKYMTEARALMSIAHGQKKKEGEEK